MRDIESDDVAMKCIISHCNSRTVLINWSTSEPLFCA